MDPETQQAAGMFSVMTGGGRQVKAPRQENFWDFWKNTFCPNFHPFAFPFIVWVINTIMFAASLFMNLNDQYQMDDQVFLGPDPIVLANWQAMWPYKIQQEYQIWRFFTCLFLSFGFGTWVINSFFLLLIGFMLQASKISFVKMTFFYLLCGFGGQLFGATCD